MIEGSTPSPVRDDDDLRTSDVIVVPVIEENLVVTKREVGSGRLRVRTQVDTVEEVVRENVERGTVMVERVAVGRFVDAAPQIREEAGVTIIPVVEEQLVVEKRLFLVEEVHLRPTTETVAVEIPATRRVMRAVIEHTENNRDENHGE